MAFGSWASILKAGSVAALALPLGTASGPLRSLVLPPLGQIPPSYFGLHIHRLTVPVGLKDTQIPWPAVPFSEWRLWDARVNWPYLEPQRGVWDFTVLDRNLEQAEKRGVRVLLPLGLTPVWASSRPTETSAYSPGWAAEPRDIDDWKTYIRTVAKRYKGRVKYYEVWNEPNYPDFYSGTVDSLVELSKEAYKTLKEIDPTITVVSPSGVGGSRGTKWLDTYLSKGGGKYCDVIGFHFYVSPKQPEAMIPLIKETQNVISRHNVSKPVWNTETGYYIENQFSAVEAPANALLSLEQASAYLARTYIINWAFGVKRLYWYSWDNRRLGLTEQDGVRLKQPATAYATIQKWLIGAEMTRLSRTSEGIWACQLKKGNSTTNWVVWNVGPTAEMALPENWQVYKYQTLDGKMISLRSTVNGVAEVRARSLQVSGTPILLVGER